MSSEILKRKDGADIEKMLGAMKSMIVYMRDITGMDFTNYQHRFSEEGMENITGMDPGKNEFIFSHEHFTRLLEATAEFFKAIRKEPEEVAERNGMHFVHAFMGTSLFEDAFDYVFRDYLKSIKDTPRHIEAEMYSRSYAIVFGTLCAYSLDKENKASWIDFEKRVLNDLMVWYVLAVNEQFDGFIGSFNLEKELESIVKSMEKDKSLRNYIDEKVKAIPEGAGEELKKTYHTLLHVLVAFAIPKVEKSEVEEMLSESILRFSIRLGTGNPTAEEFAKEKRREQEKEAQREVINRTTRD